ncbi:MAG: hypothetical protein J5892_02285 [Bacilli bacterium]|nr:hypothetical protein [Bacilli bacterium]
MMNITKEMLIFTLKMPVIKLYDNEKYMFIAEALKCPGSIQWCRENKPFDFSQVDPYDIRFWILENHNWTPREKETLVKQFYYVDGLYEKVCEEWDKAKAASKTNERTLKQVIA